MLIQLICKCATIFLFPVVRLVKMCFLKDNIFFFFFRKPTQVEWRYDEEGNRVRVSLRSGKILPIPAEEEETLYYKTLKSYIGKDIPLRN